MAKQSDVYTLPGLYQLRINKKDEKLLEETLEELKNKMHSLEAENEKIRNSLVQHGIMTPNNTGWN